MSDRGGQLFAPAKTAHTPSVALYTPSLCAPPPYSGEITEGFPLTALFIGA
jgi:hypothetical protein